MAERIDARRKAPLGLGLGLTLALVLAGCSQPDADVPGNGVATFSTPPAPTPAPAIASAPISTCADTLPVALDRASFVGDNGRPISPAALDGFRQRAADAFRDAADHRCGVDKTFAARLAKIRAVLVQSGSGATEATFYEDEDVPGTLIFQWDFSEEKLALPDKDGIGGGLSCWGDPKQDECADSGD